MRSFGVALLLSASLAVAPALAQPKGAPSSAPAKPALDVPDSELPPLPSLPALKKEEPDPEAQKALEALLARLTSEKKDIRDGAMKELGKLGKPRPADPAKASAGSTDGADEIAWAPAVRARVQEIRERLDRDRAPRILADARKAAKKGLSKEELADDDGGDWLEFMLRSAAPKDDTWRDVVELLAMVRVLGAVGTTPAVRELIELRANFGDLLRIDLARQIHKLKDRAVPALLEAKKHDATVVQRFADSELDRLGKVTPGEAVSTSDYEVLTDTLRAFGYTKNEEAVDVLLSFANHERRKIREAAREAVAAIGEAGRWRLRDVYQDLTGEKIDKSLPWDVVARRIFAIYDKGRVAELWSIFTSGLEAGKASQHAVAVEAFDKVLARDPLFERRREMAPSYFAHAKTIGFDRAEERIAMLRKAKRLDPKGADVTRIEAEIAFSEAKVLIEEGRPDRFLVQRAVELDPTHSEAKALLDGFEEQALKEPAPPPPRYGLAGAIAGATVALMGLVAFLLLRRPPPKKPGGGASQPGGGGSPPQPQVEGSAGA